MSANAHGLSGKEYHFKKYELSSACKCLSCVYIYAKELNGSYNAIYIGMTTRSFSERYVEHEYDNVNNCAHRNGANCLLIHSRGDTILGGYTEDELKAIEEDLLNNYKTPCNTKNN